MVTGNLSTAEVMKSIQQQAAKMKHPTITNFMVNPFANEVDQPPVKRHKPTGNQPTVSTDASAQPPKGALEKILCRVCGYMHAKERCRYWYHGNSNHEKNIAWADSTNGKLLASLGFDKLEKKKVYDTTTKMWSDYIPPKPTGQPVSAANTTATINQTTNADNNIMLCACRTDLSREAEDVVTEGDIPSAAAS
jgi:hypothetical protein